MTPNPHLRHGTIEDAPILTELVNYAGEGMPLYLWSKMAQPGESGWDVGCRRAAREEGCFSSRNAIMVDHRGEGGAGCLIGYVIPDDPVAIGDDMPALDRKR